MFLIKEKFNKPSKNKNAGFSSRFSTRHLSRALAFTQEKRKTLFPNRMCGKVEKKIYHRIDECTTLQSSEAFANE